MFSKHDETSKTPGNGVEHNILLPKLGQQSRCVQDDIWAALEGVSSKDLSSGISVKWEGPLVEMSNLFAVSLR